MKDELREKIITVFVKRGHRRNEIVEEVKEILSLINAQRCVWTGDMLNGWTTSCGTPVAIRVWGFSQNPFCPCCGKRIEIKEVKDAG